MKVLTGCTGGLLTDPTGSSVTLPEAVEAFLLSRRVGNCSAATLKLYRANLSRFEAAVGVMLSFCTSVVIQRYLMALGAQMKPVSLHQHYRVLRTFFNWAVEVGFLADTPMRVIKMKVPRTLPRVPDDEAVRTLLALRAETFEDHRNKALVALLVDSGLRISEALRLRIGDLDFVTLTLIVRGGKGGNDGIGYFGPEAAQIIRAWLKLRPGVAPEDYLFADRQGRPLSRSHGTHVLHRMSARAGLERKIGPHALRHHTATSILKQTGDLELVRQVLRHASLTMSIRYTHLLTSDVSAKFRRASPLNNLRAGK